MLKYNHGLDVKEASVNSQDITIKVVCLTTLYLPHTRMGGACTGRVQGVRNLPGSYGTGQVGTSSACRTRALLCSPLMHPITVPHICIPVCCVSCVA